MKLKLVLVITFLRAVLAIPPHNPGVNRDALPDLLGLDPSETWQMTRTATSWQSQGTNTGGDTGGNIGFDGFLPPFETSTRTKTSTSTSVSTATYSSTSATQHTSSTTSTSAHTSEATSTAAATVAGSSLGDSKTWKVIGVSFISVIAVVVVIVSIIFWDRGTRFVKGVLCGGKRSDGIEDFVPDWEKRSWEVKLAEDNHRYPAVPSDSFASLVRVPSAHSYSEDEDDKRHPFALRPGPSPGPVPVFVDFVSPDDQNTRPMENHPYSPMTAPTLQRQNSHADQSPYTAYA